MPPKTQTKTPVKATLLKADFWLQHVTDTSNDDADSDYSLFWLVQTGQKWPDHCCLCGSEPPTCGAHMFSIRADLAGVVIVPACTSCNNNVSKTAKYASTKFSVWAAHVGAHELQRIERRQRQTERHLRAEARIKLLETLPPAGVPIPITTTTTTRKKYVARFCVPPDGDDDDEWQQQQQQQPRREPTPIPASPVADAPVPPPRVRLGPKPNPNPSPPPAATAAAKEYKELVGLLDDGDDFGSRFDGGTEADATPRPMRRRERAPVRPRHVVDALREINRCKQPIDDGDSYCNRTVCSKLKCSGSSKVYCCAHCGCLSCVKPAAVASKSK